MIAFREGSENGGPYNSHLRIMNSRLKEQYRFLPLIVPKGKMGALNWSIVKNLITQIRETNPDAVQIIGLELIGFYLALACRIVGVKNVIVAIHGSTTEAIEFNKNPIKKWLMQQLEIFTLKTGSYTYGVSDYVYTIKNVARYSKKYFGSIYNMLLEDTAHYNREEIRREFELNEDIIAIMSTGRLIREKGCDTLIDIMKHYENDNKVVFIIAGDGDYKPVMEEKLGKQIQQGQVKLLGYRSDISRILSAGDIFVMPSYHETLCMSLIEAGQKGLALVASNVGGMKEVIDNGKNGYLVEPGNAEAFIKKIEILRNQEKLKSVKESAYQIINKKFSNSIAVERLDKLYASLFGE